MLSSDQSLQSLSQVATSANATNRSNDAQFEESVRKLVSGTANSHAESADEDHYTAASHQFASSTTFDSQPIRTTPRSRNQKIFSNNYHHNKDVLGFQYGRWCICTFVKERTDEWSGGWEKEGRK